MLNMLTLLMIPPWNINYGLLRIFVTIERFFMLKIQKGYFALQDRTMDRMIHTTVDSYLDFILKYKNLEQRFPRYYSLVSVGSL